MKLFFEDIEQGTPYMLRNDGEMLLCGRIHPYLIDNINETLEESIKYLFGDNYRSFSWFYKNTAKQQTRDNLRQLFIEYWCLGSRDELDKKAVEYLIGSFTEADSIQIDKDELFDLYRLCNNETNQEFCRVRLSGLKYGVYNNGIYFRISSVGFNWFNLIWEVVYKLKDRVSDVTICTDTQSKGGYIFYYKHNGQIIDRMPVDEFINLSGRPVIESFDSCQEEDLYAGMTLDEAFVLHPRKVNRFVESLWKKQLENEFVYQ